MTFASGSMGAVKPRFRLRLRLNQTGISSKPVHLSWFVKFFLAYLAAITIFGKGPTYLGVSPIYWGELTMITGLLLIMPQIKRTDFLEKSRILSIVIVAFMFLGLVLTAVSVPQWGMEALRDAAIWYYALFFFIGLGLAAQPQIADRVWYLIRNAWMLALVWNTADTLSRHNLSQLGPRIPGRGVPLIWNSIHEAGQNLALGALIVLCTATLSKRPHLRAFLIPTALVGLAAFAASNGRGMRTGISVGALVVLLLSFSPVGMPHFTLRLLKFGIFLVPVLLVIAAAMPNQVSKAVDLDHFAEADPSNPQGTAGWRMIWWQRIYAEVMKRNPAFGLGFGESLSVYHPLLESMEGEGMVKSPHNFNVTIFARMGITGLLIWLTIVLVGIGSLFGRVWRGTVNGQPYAAERRDELTFWILMLICTIVNSSFGVLMEGPVLGIWFWFALGFATARSFGSGIELHPRIMGARVTRSLRELQFSFQER